MPCVWACLRGQGAAVRAELERRGCLANTAVVEAPAGAPPAHQFATAAAALAVAEGFRDNGRDSFVVIDDWRSARLDRPRPPQATLDRPRPPQTTPDRPRPL